MSTVKIKEIHFINHDVLHIATEKPQNFSFEPGQATEVAINKPDWKDEKRPFTFTNLPENEHLEFTIKTYPEHDGVTEQLGKLTAGDELIIGDSWGAISYQGTGVFLAGGAGITPFLAIFKKLDKEQKLGGNKLIFGNKKKEDIIYAAELEKMLGDDFINILSDEEDTRYASGYIDKEFIKKHINTSTLKKFYVCGPPPMMDSVLEDLKALGVTEERIVMEAME
ncbi:MAG: flavodoxin reductase [Leeuwenhoekiella sp.]|nr:MAG: flavodoxin reductase [Leeuwenhoekiella sp.]